MTHFANITTDKAVHTYKTATGVFEALLSEIRELSKKKPDATLSASKVKIVNKVLADLLTILEDEPEGKYIQLLEDEALPQVSDALMMMVQFEAAAKAFSKRYHRRLSSGTIFGYLYLQSGHYWITAEQVGAWQDEAEHIRQQRAEED